MSNTEHIIRYPLSDVTVTEVDSVKAIINPLYLGLNIESSPAEFYLHVPEVGSFYAANGNSVEYSVEKNADPEWVSLCLNGQVLVALLHQRKIINFHASSFVYNGKGVMILGETGAGKSSLTTSFILDGAGFLTDDLTPVVFDGTTPCVMPMKSAVKLEHDSIEQLRIPAAKLKRGEEGTGKHYMTVENKAIEKTPLNMVFKVEIGDNMTPLFSVPEQAERFSILRSEVCSWEMLAGMPDTESDYLHQLLGIVQKVRVVKLIRPVDIGIKKLRADIVSYLSINR